MIKSGWNRFWFGHGSSRNISACRIIFASQGLWIMLSRDFGGNSDLPAAFWADTPMIWMWRYLIFPGLGTFESILQWLAVATLLLALFGVASRASCLLAGILLYHLAPLESLIWTSDPTVRGLTITVPGLIIMSMARSADAYVPFWVKQGRSRSDPALDYSWQLRLIQLLLCQVYLFSAIGKLDRSGLAWITSDNLQNWFRYLSQVPDIAVFKTPGEMISGMPLMNWMVAIGAIVFEAGFIAAMFSKRVRMVLIPAVFVFHALILVTMNLTFPAISLYLVFVDWERLHDRLRAHRFPAPQDLHPAPTGAPAKT